MEILTAEEYDEQYQESLAIGEVFYGHDGFDCTFKCQDRFGQEFIRSVELRPGLILVIDDNIFYRDLSKWSHHDETIELVSDFHLSGNLRTITPGIQEIENDYLQKVGQNYLFYLPNIDEIEHFFAREHFKSVTIYLSLDLFKNYSTGFESLPTPLQNLVKKNSPPRFHRSVGEITPAMFATLQQLLEAPYQGMMKRMYLESKVLELLALQLNQFTQNEQTTRAIVSLKSVDIERIYHAKDILICQQENPPSLLDLAQMVGLSDRKLRQGFREIFNNTVFGYLHDYRMEQAKLMLCSSKMRVADVANTVGYSHLGHFAAAFKRKFGITPKECQIGKPPLLG